MSSAFIFFSYFSVLNVPFSLHGDLFSQTAQLMCYGQMKNEAISYNVLEPIISQKKFVNISHIRFDTKMNRYYLERPHRSVTNRSGIIK